MEKEKLIRDSMTKRDFIKSAGILAAGTAAFAAIGGITSTVSAKDQSKASRQFEGKTAFITGAARGIGRAISEEFAKHGANIVMIDIADPSKLNSTKGYRVANMEEFNEATEAVKAKGAKVLQIQADVRDLKALESTAKMAKEKFGGIDIVVANAGYVAWHSFEDGTPRQWEEVIDVNVLGVFFTLKATIPFLKERGGRIINIASVGGRAGFAGNGAYTSSKWAVIGMTKQAAQELGKYNITVNAIAPGPVNTPMYRSEGQMRSMGVSTAEGQDTIIGPMCPLGKASIEPEEIAYTALYLAGEGSRTISGATIDNALGYNSSYTA